MFRRGMTRGQRVLWRITRPFLVLWLFLEFFRSLIPFGYSLLPEDFRSFMFDDFIDLWRRYIAQHIPTWLDDIPTWNAEGTQGFLVVWGLAFLLLGRGSKRNRRQSADEPARSSPSKPCSSCAGLGWVHCKTCGGTGHGSAFSTSAFCQACGGKTTTTCPRCRGSGKA